MKYTVSGLWTSLGVFFIMTAVLAFVYLSPMYLHLKPTTLLVCFILSMIKIAFPFELSFMKVIAIKSFLPRFNTAIRRQLFGIRNLSFNLIIAFLLIWSAVALVKLVKFFKELKKVNTSFQYLPDAGQELLEVFEVERDKFVKHGDHLKNCRYKVCNECNSPFTIGIRKPIIVIPAYITQLGAEDLGLVLRHEWSHILKKDGIVKTGCEIAVCIFWWVPFLRMAARYIEGILEIRADWLATKDMDDYSRTEYLQVLMITSVRHLPRNEYPVQGLTKGVGRNLIKRFRFITQKEEWAVFDKFFLVLFLTGFIISYCFIIEPAYTKIPEDTYFCTEECVIVQEDGRYKIYMDGIYVADTDNLDFLAGDPLADITVVIDKPGQTEQKEIIVEKEK